MPERTLTRVTDDVGAVALAERLNGNHRPRPVVVITIPAGRCEPFIDAEEVLEQVGDLADVYLMPTGPHTWQFSERMPDQTQVYGGAGRVYPVGHAWVSNPYLSPLRFAYNEEEGERSTRALASDALRMAAAAGLIQTSTSRHRRRVQGVVEGIPVGERALVRFERQLATIAQELTVPGVPLDRVLTVGMTVTGWFDNETKRLDIRESLRPAGEALASYAVGDVVLTRVQQVRADCARLLLHPDVLVDLGRDDVTSNDLDDLRSLMTPGEVLPARLTATDEWHLTLLDVDDEAVPVPAAALVEGGPPWLEPPPPEEPAPDWPEEPAALSLPVALVEPAPHLEPVPHLEPAGTPVEAPATAPVDGAVASSSVALPRPTPALLDRRRRTGRPPDPARPATSPPSPPAVSPAVSPAVESMGLTIDALRAEVESLQAQLKSLEAELQAGKAERTALVTMRQEQERAVARLESELRSQKVKLRKARRPSREGPEFADREQGFRHAVLTAWASRTPVAEQAERPLGTYSLGPGFLDSLDATPGVDVGKVADVVFEIVTGRVYEIAGRETHQVRLSAGPTADYIRGSDGAILWRAALQVNAPQARRIHFWALPDGSFELDGVQLHDDL